MSGSLSDALTETRTAEQCRAARAILRRPLLRADGRDAEVFTAVRRHASALREWFQTNTGWALIVNSELARLVKSVEANDAVPGEHTHPAVDTPSKQPFSRRRYVLTCLSLAALSRSRRPGHPRAARRTGGARRGRSRPGRRPASCSRSSTATSAPTWSRWCAS